MRYEFTSVAIAFKQPPGGGGEGGVLREKLGGGVRHPYPETLTLFLTKICDFPYPISDLTLESISA